MSATTCGADGPIFDLYSASIGPGLIPPPFHACPTLPSIAGSSSFMIGIGFASGTICASGVSSSNFTNALSSEIFSVLTK